MTEDTTQQVTAPIMMITEVPGSPDDGFDIEEIAARSEPEVVTEEVNAEEISIPEPEAVEPVVVDPNAKFSQPVLGKYKTVADLVRAAESQEAMLGKTARELEAARKSEADAKDGIELQRLIRENPQVAEERFRAMIGASAQSDEDAILDEQVALNSRPRQFIAETVESTVEKILARREDMARYNRDLQKVYTPEGWSGMERSRNEISAAISSGQLARDEQLQLMALGRAVRDGSLSLPESKTEPKLQINPGAGATSLPSRATRPPAAINRNDQFIEELEAVNIPGI
jgi:hypothetical protein